MLARFIGLTVAVALAACGPDIGSDEEEATARHDVEIVPTLESLQLLQPYNYVFDLGGTGQPCVAWQKPTPAARVQVSNLSTNVTINYVTSLSALQDQLGIDATLGVKVDPLGSGSLTAHYASSTSQTGSHYAYLLTVQQQYEVVAAAPIRMTGDRPAGADEFLRRCGDSYVRGLTYAASLHVLMNIAAETKTEAEQVAAGLTAKVTKGLSKLKVSGNASASVTKSKNTQSSELRVDFTLQARGFDPENGETEFSLPTSTDGTIVQDTIAALSSYLQVLSGSLAKDRAADVANNGQSPGRTAVPMLVRRGFYALAPGFSDKPNPFPIIDERTARARDFINNYGYLNAQINDVYYGEIQRFLMADSAAKARFNVAPPGAPLPNASHVATVVKEQERIFRPTGGSGQLVKNVTAGVRARIYACLESARAIDKNGATTYAACAQKPRETQQYLDALAAIDRYAASARVLPLDFFDLGDHVYWTGDCTDDETGASGVLADDQQVPALAPVIAADPEGCAWFTDTSQQCTSEPYFVSSPSTLPSELYDGYWCGSSLNVWRQCAVLCVPPAGVFGVPPSLGSGALPAP